MTCDLLLLLRRRRNHGDSEKNQRDKQLQPHSWMGQPEVEEALQILLHTPPPNRHRDLQSINNNPPTPQGPERRRRATSRDGDKLQQRENTGDKIFRCTIVHVCIYIHTHTLCMTVQRQ